MPLRYHMPLYRPPSEGNNLIVQVTLGCSYNRCSFCSMYSSKAFSIRPLPEVFADIERAALAWPEARRVFLADGDALMLPTEHLVQILDQLHARLPELTRVSSYATPDNLNRKSLEELRLLKSKGLSLVYLGIESGDAEVLKRIAKGASPKSIIKAITAAREGGLKVSAMVILGVGGEKCWQQHIDGTIAVVNAAPPHYLSTLQLHLDEESFPSFLSRWEGEFTFQNDDGILAEQERLLAGLAPATPVLFRSNHASNALALAGTLPRDTKRLQAEVAAARQSEGRLRPFFLRGL